MFLGEQITEHSYDPTRLTIVDRLSRYFDYQVSCNTIRSYQVKCDLLNNPHSVVASGRLLVDVTVYMLGSIDPEHVVYELGPDGIRMHEAIPGSDTKTEFIEDQTPFDYGSAPNPATTEHRVPFEAPLVYKPYIPLMTSGTEYTGDQRRFFDSVLRLSLELDDAPQQVQVALGFLINKAMVGVGLSE